MREGGEIDPCARTLHAAQHLQIFRSFSGLGHRMHPGCGNPEFTDTVVSSAQKEHPAHVGRLAAYDNGCSAKCNLRFREPQVLGFSQRHVLVLVRNQSRPEPTRGGDKNGLHPILDEKIQHRPAERDAPDQHEPLQAIGRDVVHHLPVLEHLEGHSFAPQVASRLQYVDRFHHFMNLSTWEIASLRFSNAPARFSTFSALGSPSPAVCPRCSSGCRYSAGCSNRHRSPAKPSRE